MESGSTVVIKVKYGDALKRFSARVVGEELDLFFDELSEKIRSLFSFSRDAELILTYVDEDGDVITLGHDDDLHEVVKQGLNPLRITVKLNLEKNDKRFNHSSSTGSSTPLRSPHVQESLQNLNAGVSEILKAVPEPLRETIVKVSTDLTSKASSSAPVVAELIDFFSKVGLSYLAPRPEAQSDVQTSTDVAVTEVEGFDASKVDIVRLEVPVIGRSEEISSKSNESSTKYESEAKKENDVVAQGNVSEAVSSSKSPVSNAVLAASDSKNISFRKKEKVKKVKKIIEGCAYEKPNLAYTPIQTVANYDWVVGNVGASSNSSSKPIAVSNNVLGKDLNLPGQASLGNKNNSINAPSPQDNWTKFVFPGSVDPVWAPSPGSSNFQGPFSGPDLKHEFPFSETSVGNPSDSAMRVPLPFPSRRSSSQTEGGGMIFHRGVRCDGCGIHPITGPRFKSKVKVDYDLCSTCLSEMGNDSDYIRIDRPAFYRPPMPFKELHGSAPTLPQAYRGFKLKPGVLKLDSRFIQDVNIIDGTVVAPLTPFTKIWRMRNNGTVVWPQKSQLVWIGGDKLSNLLSVEIEVPEAGVPVDVEVDVAVDFVAPQLPGRYISYWRMALPSGQKFGQRVWVLIQVDAAAKETRSEGLMGFNLNLPPVSNGLTGPEIINVEPEPIAVDSHPDPDLSKKQVEIVEPSTDLHPKNEHETKFPINDSLLVGSGASSSMPPPAPPVTYPIIDLSDVGPTFSSVSPNVVASALDSAPELPRKNEFEEKLLKELEAMGFKQIDLNKEILRMNEYDLEQSVDDLCGVAEWDPLLEELQEMGFRDTETNKRLLKKNNGSIKRVVMDLIAGEE